tara:strand:+ start:169 stop:744 length:576 start_codon:yes stop_codon:yes gene_type:complete
VGIVKKIPEGSYVAYQIRRARGQPSVTFAKFAYVMCTADEFMKQGYDCNVDIDHTEVEVQKRGGVRISTEHGRLLTSENTLDELIEAEKRAKERDIKKEMSRKKRNELEKVETPLREALKKFTTMDSLIASTVPLTRSFLQSFLNAQPDPDKSWKYGKKSDLLQSALTVAQKWDFDNVEHGSQVRRIKRWL